MATEFALKYYPGDKELGKMLASLPDLIKKGIDEAQADIRTLQEEMLVKAGKLIRFPVKGDSSKEQDNGKLSLNSTK